MSRRTRQPAKTIENVDLQIINTKIQLHQKLVASEIDYDHYRAGTMPHGSVIMSQPWLALGEVFCDISACDFVDFKLVLLTKYTLNRRDIDPLVPQFYEPREKEKQLFTHHMSTVLPIKIKQVKEASRHTDDLRNYDPAFILDYRTILTREFCKWLL